MYRELRILLIILLYSSSTTNASTIKSFTREWSSNKLSTGSFKEPPTIGKDNIYVHDNIPLHTNDSHISYTINYENIDNNEFVSVNKCNYGLEPLKGFKILRPVIRSHTDGKVLIRYIEFSKLENNSVAVYVKHRRIEMCTCRYKEVEFYKELPNNTNIGDENDLQLELNFNPGLVQYEDGSYDMFVLGPDLCDAARCRLKVDADGKMDDKVVSYVPKKYWNKKLQFYPTQYTDQYFIVVQNYLDKQQINFTLLYAWPDGQVKELLHIEKGEGLVDFDGTKKFLTACWSKKSDVSDFTNITCVQYNSDRKRIINHDFVLPYINFVLKVQNMNDAGFLILTQECKSDKIKDHNCIENDIYFARHYRFGWSFYDIPTKIEGFNVINEKIRIDSLTPFISYEDRENVCVSIFLEGLITESGAQLARKRFLRKCLPKQSIIKYVPVGR